MVKHKSLLSSDILFYLELHFGKITDIFERAIVTYALHVTNSPIKDVAIRILHNMRRTNEYGIYWSNHEIPAMSIRWSSNVPRTSVKPESGHEAYAVATTAYVLLTYISRAEHGSNLKIMSWLQTQRNHLAGMSSTYDSLLAHKALVFYAVSTGDTIQHYDIQLNLESTSLYKMKSNSVSINNANIIQTQHLDLENAWGTLILNAQGTGYALIQLELKYNVEYPHLMRKAPFNAFNISLTTQLRGRNFSSIDFHVCVNWLSKDYERSGFAQFQLEIPTGYRIEERLLKQLVPNVKNMAEGENIEGPGILFMFDYFDWTPNCWNFTISRYLPVANISRYYEVKVFEYYEPGNANRSMYFLRDVFGLDICEVCGSYQCPYCPYYAHAMSRYQFFSQFYKLFILALFIKLNVNI